MSFLETVRRAKAYLEEQGRVSLRALQREFDLDAAALDELVDELVDIQRVAVREDEALAWHAELQGVKGLRGSGFGNSDSPLTPNPLSYTPKHLADKILQSKSALEGERKQVTVLFADVKGSMELAEELDPEEWHRILDRFFQILTAGVHRFEGTVNQYTGDGIMALFGAPIAHEDHAQRACYAALHLRDALRRYADKLRVDLGLNFSVRMGLNSGEVIVGKIGDDLRMDYTAQGRTVGLAARMEQLAEPGKILVTEDTAKLAAGYLRFRDLGASRVKGARQALRLFELEGSGEVRTRLDASRARGLSGFVGREAEMQALEDALRRCRDGHGSILGVAGDAGLGKSRLCFEFVQRARANGTTVREAQAIAHGKLVPFLPMLDLTRSYFGVEERDAPETARNKIAGTLVRRHPALVPLLPVLLDFLAVVDPNSPPLQLDPDARQQQLLDILPRFLLAGTGFEPTVLLLEDLHWLDGGSEALLASLTEAVPRSSTLLLVNFRPEYRAKWMSSTAYQEIRLQPLAETLTGELIRHLLGTALPLTSLTKRIQERAAGNPFFVEEIVRELVEAQKLVGTRGAYELAVPIASVEVPPTVQSILGARIDRLPERDKTVLQTAAVIGRRFSGELLGRVLQNRSIESFEDALARLVAAEFLDEEALYPNVEYTFVHPLTQEVAYGSQLSDHRRRTHAVIAHALKQSSRDGLDERAALIAHHWEAAGEALEAARWYRRAGGWVSVRSSAEGLLHFRKVRELLAPVRESEERDGLLVEALTHILYLGSYEGLASDEARRCFAEALQCCQRRNDVANLVVVHARYAFFLGGFGEMDECLKYCREAIRIADENGDPGVRLIARASSLYWFVQSGQLPVALRAADEGLALLEPVDSVPVIPENDPVVVLRTFRGWALAPMGRFAEAEQALDQALERAEAAGSLTFMELAHAALAQVGQLSGSVEMMRIHARKTLELGLRIGSPRMQNLGSLNWGLYLLRSGQPREALVQFEDMQSRVEKYTVTREAEGVNLAALARAQADSGDRYAGRKTAALAVQTAVKNGTGFYEAIARLERARILFHDGPSARVEVEDELRRADNLVDQTSASSLRPLVRLEQAKLARQAGDLARFERLLEESHRLFAEMGAAGHLASIEAMRSEAAFTVPPPYQGWG